jgi:hypothetical protein
VCAKIITRTYLNIDFFCMLYTIFNAVTRSIRHNVCEVSAQRVYVMNRLNFLRIKKSCRNNIMYQILPSSRLFNFKIRPNTICDDSITLISER